MQESQPATEPVRGKTGPCLIAAVVLVFFIDTGSLSSEEPSWARKTLDSMTLAAKVGQLLFPSVTPAQLGEEGGAWPALRRKVRVRELGGIHIFRGKADVVSRLTKRLQRESKVPLLLTADLEGGAGYIFLGATRFPRPMALAASGDLSLVADVARMTAKEGRSLGIHVNFSPVLDVNINPDNPIINIRSFGEHPEEVARFGAAYIQALQEEGMIATGKHFPGHGDTSVDSHLKLPVVNANRSRLNRVELPPFREAVKVGVGAMMSAHIAWPVVSKDSGNLPATLDPSVLTGILREEMGFSGIIFTDALTMRGITDRFPLEEAAVLALMAGADVLLFAEVDTVFPAVMGAVADGRLTESRLDESVLRILAAKERLGLHRRELEGVSQPSSVSLQGQAALSLADRAARSSLIELRNNTGCLPLDVTKKKRLLHVRVLDPGQTWWAFEPGVAFADKLGRRGAEVLTLDLGPMARSLPRILARVDQWDQVLVTAYMGLAAFRGRTGLTSDQEQAIDQLGARGAILLGFGNPYGIGDVSSFDTVILGLDTGETFDRQGASAILGDFKAKGRLPVTVEGLRQGEK